MKAATGREEKRERGEGGLFKTAKSRFWYIQYYQHGRQIRVSSGTEVKDKARMILRKLMGDRDNGAVPISDVRRLRYSDLRQALISSYESKGHKSLREKSDGSGSIPGLTALDEFCGYKTDTVDDKLTVTDAGVPALSLTTDFARRFVEKRKKEKTGTAAINRSLACLRRMLNLAKREGKLTLVPYIEFQKEPTARKGFLERADFARLIKVLPTHLRPLVTFLYWCGCRIGETLQIEWGQVDLNARLIRLEPEQTKNAEARNIPLSSELVGMLREIEPKEGTVFDGTNLRKEWIKGCDACGLGTVTEVEDRPYDPIYSGLTLHDLRRSAVRNLRKAGIDEKTSMTISGHKTRSVFDRYNIVSTDDVVAAIQRVELAALQETRKPVLSATAKKPARSVAAGAKKPIRGVLVARSK
jgi:integrase